MDYSILLHAGSTLNVGRLSALFSGSTIWNLFVKIQFICSVVKLGVALYKILFQFEDLDVIFDYLIILMN